MFTKAYKITEVNGTNFEITRGWLIIAVFFTLSFSSVGRYDQYLAVMEFVFPFSIPVAFPESTIGMVVFAIGLVLGIYTSVILHEIGHSLAAQHYGIRVKTIQLWIAGGVARIETIPPEPSKEFTITIAGPTVTAALIPIFVSISMIFYTANVATLYWFFLLLGLFNAAMLVLNLTPAFPLDGGRLLRSTLARRFTYLKSTRYAAHFTIFLGLVASVIAALTIQLGYALLAVIVGVLALAEKKQIETQYDSQGWIRNPQQFLIADQAFVLDPGFRPETTRLLERYITEQGGRVVPISERIDAADIAILDSEKRTTLIPSVKTSVTDTDTTFGRRVPQGPPASVPAAVTLDVFIEHLEIHGVSLDIPLNEIPSDIPALPAVES